MEDKKVIQCLCCGKKPHEDSEYIYFAKEEEMTPEEFVVENEGTYNDETGKYYCTPCYIKIGMPAGVAR